MSLIIISLPPCLGSVGIGLSVPRSPLISCLLPLHAAGTFRCNSVLNISLRFTMVTGGTAPPQLMLDNQHPPVEDDSTIAVSGATVRAVQKVVDGTSEKFVPHPAAEQVLQDALRGLIRFRHACRWKWFFEQLKEERDDDKGLGTDLRPVDVLSSKPPTGSPELEAFLKETEREILNSLQTTKRREITPLEHG